MNYASFLCNYVENQGIIDYLTFKKPFPRSSSRLVLSAESQAKVTLLHLISIKQVIITSFSTAEIIVERCPHLKFD